MPGLKICLLVNLAACSLSWLTDVSLVLRTQTQEERDKREKVKARCEAVMQARLDKVRQRKTVQDKLGDDFDLDPMSLMKKADEASDVIGARLDEGAEPGGEKAEPGGDKAELKREGRKAGPVREWDRGKVAPPIYGKSGAATLSPI